jgi:hypothetical protein
MDPSAPFRAATVDALLKRGSLQWGFARELPGTRPVAVFRSFAQALAGVLIAFHFATMIQIHRIDLM